MKVQIDKPPLDYYYKQVTLVLIMNCLTITVHVDKCYKALIDSGAAISLVQYYTYQNIDTNLKTAIQATSIQLNTADRSPITALGIITLQLRIADFNSHTNLSYMIGYPTWKCYLALIYRRH